MNKPFLRITGLLALLAVSVPAFAQLTTDQRLADFNYLQAIYQRQYASRAWKIQALGYDPVDGSKYIPLIRAAKDDLAFYEICMQYVAAFQDGHLTFTMPSEFYADLGIRADYYDGKPLIDSIDRFTYPASRFPFKIGDEVVSIDGVPIGDIVARNAKLQSVGSGRATQRFALQLAFFVRQTLIPRAVELPDTSQVVIRSGDDGSVKTYTLSWFKFGEPVTKLGSLQSLRPSTTSRETAPSLLELAKAAHTNSTTMRLNDAKAHAFDAPVMHEEVEGVAVRGWGARNPYYALPAGFTVRRGRLSSDNFVTGTYKSGTNTIGLIRIGNFSPSSPIGAISELLSEIRFMQANTDGLVVDVTHNTGGFLDLDLDYTSLLTNQKFFMPGARIRATQNAVNEAGYYADLAPLFGAPDWVVNTYDFNLQVLKDAAPRSGLTGQIPIASGFLQDITQFAPVNDNFPLQLSDGTIPGYTKPLIVLADDLSVSAGDIFPSMIQDNLRGPVVGVRTGGLGGAVIDVNAGAYSEASTRVVVNLIERRKPIASPDFPTAPLIENIGVFPDITLDYQTRDNLLTNGKPFVDAFTAIIVDRIARSK